MKNLAQLGGQLAGIWKQLGLNQKVSIVLAGGLVVAGLLSLAFWSGKANYGLLYGKLDDAEAAKVIGVLDPQSPGVALPIMLQVVIFSADQVIAFVLALTR